MNSAYPETHPRIFIQLNASQRPSVNQQLEFLLCLDEAYDFYKLRQRALKYVFFDKDTLEALERLFSRSDVLALPTEPYMLPSRLQRPTSPQLAYTHSGPGAWRDLVPLIEALVMRDIRVHIPKDLPVLNACKDSNVRLLRTLFKSQHYQLSLIAGEQYRQTWAKTKPRYLPDQQWWTRELRPRQTMALNERLLDIAVSRQDMEVLEFICLETTAFQAPQISLQSAYRSRQWPRCSHAALEKAVTLKWRAGIEYLEWAMSMCHS